MSLRRRHIGHHFKALIDAFIEGGSWFMSPTNEAVVRMNLVFRSGLLSQTC